MDWAACRFVPIANELAGAVVEVDVLAELDEALDGGTKEVEGGVEDTIGAPVAGAEEFGLVGCGGKDMVSSSE